MHRATDFNEGWLFCKHDAVWPEDFEQASPAMSPVILPHTWNAEDMVVGNTDAYRGPGWYRKRFRPPRMQPGQRLLLEFEAVAIRSRVWMNGAYVGGRDGGFLGYQVDLTDALRPDRENTILVRADNRYELNTAMPPSVDWNPYGGIHRPAWLRIRDAAHIDYCGVRAQSVDVSKASAGLTVETWVRETRRGGAPVTVRHRLLDPDGNEVAQAQEEARTRFCRECRVAAALPRIDQPRLWSVESPALYTLHTELLEAGRSLDVVETRVGFRFYRLDKDRGFLLNGRPVKLQGADIHQFYPGLGSACPERFYVEDMRLMKAMGCNFMRTSHYPRARACLDACDELGILVMAEQPYWHGSVRAHNGEQAISNSYRLLTDMVRQHGNHPCIVMWNTVNEVMLAPAYRPGVGHLESDDPRREAWSVSESEYPYMRRAIGRMVDILHQADPERPVSMVIGGAWQRNFDAGLTELADAVACNGGSVNFPRQPFTGEATGKRYEFRPDYFRDLYPDHAFLMSEGVLNDICHLRADWPHSLDSWERHARYWDCFYARPWFAGGAMWCFTDYSANGLERPHGAVDRYRLPYELYHFYSAMWASRPVVHILGHWNWEDGDTRRVAVFTNGEHPELLLNGASLGPGRQLAAEYPHLPNAPWVWGSVPYQPGELTAQATVDGALVSDRRVTAGPPARLALTAEPAEICADGRDVSFVTVSICDADGNRCYTDFGEVTVSADGPVAVAGPNAVVVRGGLGRVAVRSNGTPGQATIAARRAGLEAGSTGLVCRPANSLY